LHIRTSPSKFSRILQYTTFFAASKGLFVFSSPSFCNGFASMLEINGFIFKKVKKRLKNRQLFFKKVWKF